MEIAVLKLQAGEALPWAEWDRARPRQVERLRELLPAIRALVGCRLEAPPNESGPSSKRVKESIVQLSQPPELVLEDFQIECEIGRGGMGIVYSAIQLSLGRTVAVKVLPLTPFLDSMQVARFRNEVRAAALLEHPHIVPIYSVGEEGGVHYYVMRLIAGMTLADSIRSTKRPGGIGDWKERASLIRQAAEALHYAHQQGVIHRDVKPSNLLVSDGHVWVTDFGLARVEGAEHVTQTGDFAGTLRYASPEQAAGKSLIIDHRTDVYSLGATLYELLTEQPVVTDGDRSWMLNQILEKEPRPLRTVRSDIPIDLETIVLKSLAKSPSDRYATAGELAEDLRRFQSDQPIRAARPRLMDRLSKWSRRHRSIVTTTAIALSIVALVSSVFSLQLWNQNQQTLSALAEARSKTREAEFQTARMAIQRGLALCDDGHVGRGLTWLAYALAKCPSDERQTAHVIRTNLNSWMTQVHPLKVFFEAAAISDLALTRDGQRLLTCGSDHRIAIRDAHTGALREQWRVGTPGERLESLALHPTQPVIAVAAREGRIAVLDLSTGQASLTMQHSARPVLNISFSPDGRRLLSRSPQEVNAWSMEGGACLGKLVNGSSQLLSAAFTSDGESLLTSSVGEQGIKQWELPGCGPQGTLTELVEAPCWEMLWMRDRRWLALTCGGRYCVRFWDREQKQFGDVQLRHLADLRCTRVDANCERMATCSEDRTARVWDWRSGQPVGAIFDHPESPTRLDLSADGKHLATACVRSGRTEVRLFDVAEGNVIPTNVKDMLPDSEFTLLGEDLLIRSRRGELQQRSLLSGDVRRTFPGAVQHFTATHEGSRLIWTDPGGVHCEIPGDSRRAWSVNHRLILDRVVLSPAGTRVLALGAKSLLIDAVNGQVIREFPVPGIARNGVAAFSPDGQRFVTGGDRGTIEVWNGETGEALAPPQPAGGRICDLCWPGGPEGILVGTIDGRISFFDEKSNRMLRHSTQLPVQFKEMNFHPGGKLALAIAGNGQARFFDTATGWTIGPPLSHFGIIKSPQYSFDGQSVVTYGEREVVRRWKVPTLEQGSAKEITRQIQALTGLSLEQEDLLRHVTADEWESAAASSPPRAWEPGSNGRKRT